MKKNQPTIFGHVYLYTLAEVLSIMEIFWISGLFFCAMQYTLDLKFMGLAILMCILQGSAIHGIYNKYFGLIIFNCVFKYLYLLLCFGLFVVASYAYTMRGNELNELKNVDLYEKIMSLSFFGILYYGFQAYLLMEIACTLPKNSMKKNSKSLSYYCSNPMPQHFQEKHTIQLDKNVHI